MTQPRPSCSSMPSTQTLSLPVNAGALSDVDCDRLDFHCSFLHRLDQEASVPQESLGKSAVSDMARLQLAAHDCGYCLSECDTLHR